ncbi:MAG TPA: hypothetical protein VLJ86_00745 [Ramlibacter sp.]|nr:hypothetical protein [Ramlibacter sp.]
MWTLLCFPWAWLGGRSQTELWGEQGRPAPASCLVGLSTVLAAIVAAAGWQSWLTGTALASYSSSAALGLSAVAWLLFRQLGRGIEASPSRWRRQVLGLLALAILQPGAWLAATELPSRLFPEQLAAHRVALQRAAQNAVDDAVVAERQRQRLTQSLSAREEDVALLTRAAMEWQPVLKVAADRVARCGRSLEALRGRLAEEGASTAPTGTLATAAPGRLPELDALESRCAEAQGRAEVMRARFEARVQQPRQEVESALKASRAALATADAAAEQAASLAARPQTSCSSQQACALRQAVADGHLSVSAAWGSTLFLLAVGLLPAALRSSLPADPAARARRQVATEDALIDGPWQ